MKPNWPPGTGLSGSVWNDGERQDFYNGNVHVASIAGGQNIDPNNIQLWINALGDNFSDASESSNIRAFGADQTIEGGAGDDTISVFLGPKNTGADIFRGGDGNDVLIALGPSDSEYSDGQCGTIALTALPRLEGGPGDGILIAEGSAILTGGEEADTFGIEYSPDVVPQNHDYQPVEITDFEPGIDFLYFEASGGAHGDQVTVKPSKDGTGTAVFVDDELIATVAGAQLTIGDIRTPEISFSSGLLGHH